MRRLEGQGLIELAHGRSATVVPLSAEDITGIYGLRRMIEPELAARSVPGHGEADLRLLRSHIDDFENTDSEVVWQAHQDFHLRLVRPAASAWDLRTLDQLWAAAERYTRLVYDFAEIARTERTRRERIHSTILDAVQSGDAHATRQAVDDHLRHNEEEMVERIEGLDPHRRDVGAQDSA
ncbi:GntR family transcriptional regulator [Pseudonocardia xishanensis]|uniref:GntR C-terminal domain-containing protein n=1 Tax=Pseudonocardia xishanensis TaxID=630995 RepID=A0ABP8S2X6_9PSEU